MRLPVALVVVLAACGDDGGSTVLDVVDAKVVDAGGTDGFVDAPADAPLVDGAMEITTACTNACTKLGACFTSSDPQDLQDCIGECSADLVDCTAQQVMEIDQCSQLACGVDEKSSPVVSCIAGISCVDM